mmetsp:Transcript_56796/g.118781  ORF Transcript_56796/g.118781 Transcript_56796/m.118781 type:complete len:97 (-) Transcript_56796:69-359(-)
MRNHRSAKNSISQHIFDDFYRAIFFEAWIPLPLDVDTPTLKDPSAGACELGRGQSTTLLRSAFLKFLARIAGWRAEPPNADAANTWQHKSREARTV